MPYEGDWAFPNYYYGRRILCIRGASSHALIELDDDHNDTFCAACWYTIGPNGKTNKQRSDENGYVLFDLDDSGTRYIKIPINEGEKPKWL